MNSYTKQAINFRLYLITDRKLFPDNSSLFTAIEEALRGGVRAVQLREKDYGVREILKMAYQLRELTHRYNAKLFINDRADIAIAADADGIHLGQNGIPAHAAKKISHGKLVTGVSAHSLTEALAAEKDGADFITLGPVYETASKLRYGSPAGIDVLKDVCSKTNIPVFAIGGITADRAKEVMACRAEGIALISAILKAGDIQKTTETFMRYIQ